MTRNSILRKKEQVASWIRSPIQITVIVMGVNSSSTLQVCSSIDIEEHRGPCKCKCLIKQCHYNQVFNRDLCQCNCKDSFAVLKRDCLTNGGGRAINFWDDESCSCKCKPRRCVKGHYQGAYNIINQISNSS